MIHNINRIYLPNNLKETIIKHNCINLCSRKVMIRGKKHVHFYCKYFLSLGIHCFNDGSCLKGNYVSREKIKKTTLPAAYWHKLNNEEFTPNIVTCPKCKEREVYHGVDPFGLHTCKICNTISILKKSKLNVCRTCGKKSAFPGAAECTNCWEVEHRLSQYIQSQRGIDFIKHILNK